MFSYNSSYFLIIEIKEKPLGELMTICRKKKGEIKSVGIFNLKLKRIFCAYNEHEEEKRWKILYDKHE